ncbi:MAG: hypothetical protein EOM19_02615 [Candidatus Moranbacteria bacterium]|nr:hypothetical protein [Candidatus Moranbacteria bacterium]
MKSISFGKKYILLASIFMLVFFASIFSISYLLREIREENENIYKKLADVQWQENRLQSLVEIREHQKKIQDFQQIFNKNIIKEGEEISFIAFLEEIANQSGVEMTINTHQAIVFDKTKKEKEPTFEYGKNIEPFDLEIKLFGQYRKNIQFLYLLENAPTVVHIQSLDISQKGREKDLTTPLSGSGILQEKNTFLEEDSLQEKKTSYEENNDFSMNMIVRIYIQKEVLEGDEIKKETEVQK